MKLATFWFKLAAGIAILLLLFAFKVNIGQVGQAFTQSQISWIILAGALHIIGLFISAYRWQLLLSAQAVQAPMWGLLQSYLIGGFFNNFLPTRVGGDVYRAIDSKRYSASLLRPIAVIIMERLTGVYGLLLIGVAAVALYPEFSLRTLIDVIRLQLPGCEENGPQTILVVERLDAFDLVHSKRCQLRQQQKDLETLPRERIGNTSQIVDVLLEICEFNSALILAFAQDYDRLSWIWTRNHPDKINLRCRKVFAFLRLELKRRRIDTVVVAMESGLQLLQRQDYWNGPLRVLLSPQQAGSPVIPSIIH